ncbi:glucosaminidase domain-containing protein [Parabacteroides sp. HGS0025]|uniref:glucosaminidase domain-containing protein n=1 Tax=Parabacteroides sp. HGS0025 TaxID=1078087 RepID=UPI0006174D69|nr:glucosaminidase domain-containing protein [Parabacteroides sp. HGS0025]
MRNTILIASLLMLNAQMVSAQFYTITKEAAIEAVSSKNVAVHKGEKDSLVLEKDKKVMNDTMMHHKVRVQKCDHRASLNQVRTKVSKKKPLKGLPELTIPNLYAEIKRYNIQHPKVVLAQAILETGWFTSPLCRNRHNLFGLTNPRLGQYYEFDHWTESVRAYYTKVQYRYKGGNYLVWLRDIGYAEDPNYIRSVIKVLKML